MAVTTSPRLGITRWSSEDDLFDRSELDADHATLDNLVAVDIQDVLANRPAAGVRGRFFTESAASGGLPGATWREDGASWRSVGSRIVAASPSDVAHIVRGAAGQTAALSQWQNGSGSSVASVDKNGAIASLAGLSAMAASISAPINGNGYGPSLAITPTYTPDLPHQTPAIIKGAPGQVAPLLEVHSSAGLLLSSLSATGRFREAAARFGPAVSTSWTWPLAYSWGTYVEIGGMRFEWGYATVNTTGPYAGTFDIYGSAAPAFERGSYAAAATDGTIGGVAIFRRASGGSTATFALTWDASLAPNTWHGDYSVQPAAGDSITYFLSYPVA